MFKELSSCPLSLFEVCGMGYISLVAFLISSYFVDSLLRQLEEDQSNKDKLKYFIFSLPYTGFIMFSIATFFNSITITTYEKMFSAHLLLSLLVYFVFYKINDIKKVRELNLITMVTFLVTILLFILVV